MKIGDIVRFHRPGSEKTTVTWTGRVEKHENEQLTVRDLETKQIRIVEADSRWLSVEPRNPPAFTGRCG